MMFCLLIVWLEILFTLCSQTVTSTPTIPTNGNDCGRRILVNLTDAIMTGDIIVPQSRIDPGTSHNISSEFECHYSISVAESKVIKLHFVQISIKPSFGCMDSYIKITAKVELPYGEKLPELICGNPMVDPVVLPSNHVNIVYRFTPGGNMDVASTDRGNELNETVAFHIRYEIIDRPSMAKCQQHIWADVGQSGMIQSPNFPALYPENSNCLWTITGPQGSHIRLSFNSEYHIEESRFCEDDYLHVGNDVYRIDFSSATSSKHCGNEAPFEIVSRGSYLWVQFKSDISRSFTGFQAEFQVLQPDLCKNSSYFQCSTVQCVHRSKLCNGISDCTNARDEYCNGTSSSDETCLQCNDGTCIAPFLSPYDTNYGRDYWWFCDGYNHCKDGTDETIDVCFTLGSRYHAMFRCQAPSYDFMILQKYTCDGNLDCPYGEDEAPAMCHTSSDDKKWKPNVTAIVLPLVLAAVVMGVFILIYAVARKRQKNEEILRNFRRQKRFSSSLVTTNPALLMKSDRFRNLNVPSTSNQSKV